MTDKRVLIITGTTDKYRDSFDPEHKYATMESVFDVTLPSKQRYVQRHGYNIMCLRSFSPNSAIPSDDTFNNLTRDLGFSRVIECFRMLNWYDVVFWADADSLITNPEISIHDIIGENNSPFILSHDWSTTKYASTGNFIIQKTEYVAEFMESFCNVAKGFQEEQCTINHMWKDPLGSKMVSVIDHKFLNSIPTREMYGSSWNGRFDIISNWTPDSFLIHLTGVDNTTRHNILQNHFSDFL